MASPTMASAQDEMARQSVVDDEELPLLYEDDEEEDLGESNPHVVSEENFRHGVKAHLSGRPEYQVYSNMNLYYDPKHPAAYVSPDSMVVKPLVELPEEQVSYRIGKDGPAPLLTAEVLSEQSAQQQDRGKKLIVYRLIGVREYVLIDVSGRFLPERLLLMRLQDDGTWKEERDADGGITSELGFRLILDTDGQIRVLDAATGMAYVRPAEAQERLRAAEAARLSAEEQQRAAEEQQRAAEEQQRAEAEARARAEAVARAAEERIHALEAELARLRGTLPDSGKN